MKINYLCLLFVFFYTYGFSQNNLEKDTVGSLSVDLSDVYVTRTLPSLSNHIDRMEMQVNTTALSEAGTLTDILQKAPKVKVDNKYGIFVGTDEATIYINGREIPENNVLDMLSSKEIEKIEIITNPSIKYDSKAKVIINIITLTNNKKGLEIELTGRLRKSEYWDKYIGADIRGKYSKLLFYTSYVTNPRERLYKEMYGRDIKYNQFDLYVINDLQTRYKTYNDNKIKGGIEYELSDRQVIGAEGSFMFNKQDNNQNNTSRLFLPDNKENPIYELSSHMISDDNRKYNTGSFFHNYSTDGFKIKTIADISYFSNKNIQRSEDLTIHNYNDALSRLTGVRTDMEFSINEILKLEAGGRYQYTSYKNDNEIFNQDQIIYTDSYKYNERLGSLYGLISVLLNDLTLSGGAKIEYINNRTNTTLFQQDTVRYILTPNVALDYQFNDYVSLNTSYSIQTPRPTFNDLNPAIGMVDSLFYRTGNPTLTDEKRHNFQVKLNYRKMSLAFNYIRRNNAIVWMMDQVPEKQSVTRSTQHNIKRAETYSLDATIPYIHDYFNFFLATGLIHSDINDDTNLISLNQTLWYATFNLNLNLPFDMYLNINNRYFTKGIMNVFYFDPAYRMDLSLKKIFLKKRLSVVLSWDDVFKTDKLDTYTIMGDRHVSYNYSYDPSFIGISVSYNFNLPYSDKKTFPSKSQ